MGYRQRKTYRIASNRMPRWDYSGEGGYFITFVTQNRECHLGEIEKGKILLSDWGKIVNDEWLKSFEIRKELICDEYIIMPNHLHAIIIIAKPDIDNGAGDDGRQMARDLDDGDIIDGGDIIMNDGHIIMDDGPVQTHGRASLQPSPPSPPSSPPPPSPPHPDFFRQPKSLSSFIAGFKSAINSKIDDYIDLHQLDIPKYNRKNHFFQPNYHDHIIRNHDEYLRIKHYIIDNPGKWERDTLKL